MIKIKYLIFLLTMVGVLACNAKKESTVSEENSVEVVEVSPGDVPSFSNPEFQKFVDDFDKYVDEGIAKIENNEFSTGEEKKALAKYQNNIKKYFYKLETDKAKKDEKEQKMLTEYLEAKKQEIEEKAKVLLVE